MTERQRIIYEVSYRARSRAISVHDALLSIMDEGYAEVNNFAVNARVYVHALTDRSYQMLLNAAQRDVERMTL